MGRVLFDGLFGDLFNLRKVGRNEGGGLLNGSDMFDGVGNLVV